MPRNTFSVLQFSGFSVFCRGSRKFCLKTAKARGREKKGRAGTKEKVSGLRKRQCKEALVRQGRMAQRSSVGRRKLR